MRSCCCTAQCPSCGACCQTQCAHRNPAGWRLTVPSPVPYAPPPTVTPLPETWQPGEIVVVPAPPELLGEDDIRRIIREELAADRESRDAES